MTCLLICIATIDDLHNSDAALLRPRVIFIIATVSSAISQREIRRQANWSSATEAARRATTYMPSAAKVTTAIHCGDNSA